MGCLCSKSSSSPGKSWQRSEEDKRRLQAEAAERRAEELANRGMGDPEKARRLQENQSKQEWIGRIMGQYQLRNMEIPLGLSLASIDQLKQHYDRVIKLPFNNK